MLYVRTYIMRFSYLGISVVSIAFSLMDFVNIF